MTLRGISLGGRRVGPALVVLAAALFLLHAWAFRFTQDDAYISLQYARNLVEGHGLVFNVGERVEGYSNFAWTLLLALLLKLGLPALDIARGAGVLFALLALFFATRFARDVEGRWGAASVGTAVLVAASTPYALWSASGMETAFHTFVVTALLGRAFAARPTSRTRRDATLLSVLAALSRPDGPLFFVAWTAIRVFDVLRTRAGDEVDSWRAVGRDVLVFTVPLALYAAWKLAYYGDVVPNTYYAKTGLATLYVARGLAEVKDYVLAYGAWLAAPTLAAAAVLHATEGPRLARLLLVLGIHAAYVVVGAGGDVLPYFRFWLPILPLGCALVALGAGVVADRIGGRVGRRRGLATAGAVSILVAVGLFPNWDRIQERRRAMDGAVRVSTARWLRDNLGPGEAIAATPIGAVAYWSGRPVIDMLGLVDCEIARRPAPIEGLSDTWREKKYNAASVLRRRPGAILFSTGVRPSAAGEQALFLYEDFHSSYYPLYFRPDPDMVQPATIYRLRTDAPAPPDTLTPVADREFLEHWCRGLIATLIDRDPVVAVREFESSVRTSPPFFLDGLEWWSATRYERGDTTAVPVMEEVLRLDPFRFLAAIRLVHWYLGRDDLDRAERVCRGLVQRNPYDARAWQALAEIARRRGRPEEAERHAERSLGLWSTNESAWALRANLALESSRSEVAEESLRRLLELNPGAEDARAALAALQAARGGAPAWTGGEGR